MHLDVIHECKEIEYARLRSLVGSDKKKTTFIVNKLEDSG